MSAIENLLNAAGNLSALGEHWRKLIDAAEAELKEREANLRYALGAQAASLQALAERDRADAERNQRDVELRAAFAKWMRTKPSFTAWQDGNLVGDFERWAAKGGGACSRCGGNGTDPEHSGVCGECLAKGGGR